MTQADQLFREKELRGNFVLRANIFSMIGAFLKKKIELDIGKTVIALKIICAL